MKINIARFYKREQWKLECEVITPMFLGNANQEAELRAAPFKGLLRYWWRVANGAAFATPSELLAAENSIFGSSDENTGGKSRVTVEVKGELRCFPAQGFPRGRTVRHPEVNNRPIDRFLYLGYGPITWAGGLKSEGKGALVPGQHFILSFTAKQDILKELESTFHCFQQFGSIGGRSRNGWGCFSMAGGNLPTISDAVLFQQLGTNWQNCFDRDYPHRLGLADHQLLLWRCRDCHEGWQEVMNELAEIYLEIRLEHQFQGNGPHSMPQDRHALGYPAGRNHGVQQWGNQGRHGSALRLIVRKEAEDHRGYILHLPHLFSREMWPNGKERQIEIWQKVHHKLDTLCQRVTSEEARS